MYVELHLLQNFPPSCLNRDDTNSPKDCVFGGYRRARISSQCLKRAVRTHFREAKLLPKEDLARRSKRLVGEAAKQLVTEHGRDEAEALVKTSAALASQKLQTDDDHETQYLLFLGEREIAGLAGAVHEHWDAIPTQKSDGDETGQKESAKDRKKKGRAAVPDDVRAAVAAVLDGGRAADLALFGRMVADLPQKNVDAACQVAHALSTNKVAMEMDFFTAVDDLKNRAEEDDAGAGMVGTVEFNSSCFYRYASLNLDQLLENLQQDRELAQRTVEAFLRSSAEAIPTGRQNSFAAHNPPSLVFAVVRERGQWSLANAFADPARPRGDRSLVADSIRRLDDHWHRLRRRRDRHPRRVRARRGGGAEVDDLSELRMVVRVDREGELLRDYQTAGGGRVPGLKQYGVAKAGGAKPDTVVSDRYYLADADFLVALSGEAKLLRSLDQALRRPVWPLYLGRKAYVPASPVWLRDGSSDVDDPEERLRAYAWRRPRTGTPRSAAAGEGCELRRGRGRHPARRPSQLRRAQVRDAVRPNRLDRVAGGQSPRPGGGVMYLSRLVLDSIRRDVLRDLGSPYEMHRTLMRAFPEEAAGGPGRVLFRIEPIRDESPPVVLVQSDAEPAWRSLADGYASEVDVTRVVFAPRNPTEPDAVPVRAGQRLRFRLLANPTVKRQGKRHGVFGEDGQRAWLSRKAEAAGFAVEGGRCSSFPRERPAPVTGTAVSVPGSECGSREC